MDFGTEYDFDVLARHRLEIRQEVARALLADEVRRSARATARPGRRHREMARTWFGRSWRRGTTG